MQTLGLLVISVCLLAASVFAETVKDREGAVRNDKAAMENDARWVYNDVPRGFAEAKRTGKPLLVTLRCVPCLSCAGIDAQVLLQQTELSPLLDRFVCVRVINANALDLALFQFDYDLSFSTLFFNGDGTVYGRYGSWTHQTNSQDRTTAGYKRALVAALDIHRGYPANKSSLAGKQGKTMPYKTPVEIPTLQGKYRLDLDWSGKVVPSCVHCHQIGDAFRVGQREKKQPLSTDLIYPWPGPETIGLRLAPDHVAKVETVLPGSAAEQAGFQTGDEITSLEGQRLLSIADVSWVLHHAPDSGKLTATIKRAGVEHSKSVALAPDWRQKSDISRRVGTWGMRGMATGGLVLEDLSDELRGQRNLKRDALALQVKMVGQYGKHAAAKNAGFRKDDLIVEMDGLSRRMTEGELIGQLLQKRHLGEKVKATVLRGTERVDLLMPMQ